MSLSDDIEDTIFEHRPADDIRNRPFPKRERPVVPTEETYKFPDGSICRIYLTAYRWMVEHDRGTGSAGSLTGARKIKDNFLTEVCTEMSERARGIRE